jgi:ribosomal protein L34E
MKENSVCNHNYQLVDLVREVEYVKLLFTTRKIIKTYAVMVCNKCLDTKRILTKEEHIDREIEDF